MTAHPLAHGTRQHLGSGWVALAAVATGFVLGLLQPLIVVAIGAGLVAGPSAVGLAFLLCLVSLPIAGFVALIAPSGRHAAALVAIASCTMMGGMVAGNVVAGAAHISWAAPRAVPTPEPPTGAEWTVAGSMHTARHDHTATLLPDGRVLVAGGLGADERPMVSAELFDPRTGQWTETGSMLTAHGDHLALLLPDSRVLVVGSSADSAEVFDPVTGSWSGTASPATQRRLAAAAILDDGRVLLTGGLEGSTGPAVASAELFDPATGSWTPTAPMITARSQHSATLLSDGRILVAGGFGNTTTEANPVGLLTAAELYDPVTASWTATGDMVFAAGEHVAVALDDDRVLATGTFACCQVYSSGTERWDRMGDSQNGGSPAIRLPDGRVLMVGLFSTFQLWDPAAPTADQPSINARHGSGATVTLLDGRVLFVGGTVLSSSGGLGLDSTVLATADLFDPTAETP